MTGHFWMLFSLGAGDKYLLTWVMYVFFDWLYGAANNTRLAFVLP